MKAVLRSAIYDLKRGMQFNNCKKIWKLKTGRRGADMILTEFKPQSVTVEVKKFPISQARHVSVTLTKRQN